MQRQEADVTDKRGDQTFRASGNKEWWPEMTYGGALSFGRRRYSRDLADIDVVISGIPYDNAVTYRPGTRLGPRAIRAGSVQLTELKHFPTGIEPCEQLSLIDYGDGRGERMCDHRRRTAWAPPVRSVS